MARASQGTRLQKRLAQLGVSSRREGERLITAGRVKVDGEVVTELGTRVSPGAAIAVDGVSVSGGSAGEVLVYALNKPRGYVCTREDPQGRDTIYDLLPPELPFLGHVGRLDVQTEGVLLLTNDGELTQGLLAPDSDVPRVYEVKIRGRMGPKARHQLEAGVPLDDRPTRPIIVERMTGHRSKHDWIRLTVFEGKNRHVRRVCEAVGHSVTRLRRASFGGVDLEGLPLGHFRPLASDEVARLRGFVRAR